MINQRYIEKTKHSYTITSRLLEIMLVPKRFTLFSVLIFHHVYETCSAAFDSNGKCLELKESGELSYDTPGGSDCWKILNSGNKMITLNTLKLYFDYIDKFNCHLNYFSIEREGDDSVKTLCMDSVMPVHITSESSIEMKFRATPSYGKSTLLVNYEIRDIRCSDENVFRCSNLSCISRFKLCDGVRDCVNGLDERNCSNYDNVALRSKASPTIFRDCIEFLQDEEENDEVDENMTKLDMFNETVASVQSNSSQVPNAFRKKVKRVQVASISARAADAVFSAKEAVRIFYENEEKRAQEKHAWEKERAEREELKHAKEMELLQAKIDSENKD